jgi:hypothetical protein
MDVANTNVMMSRSDDEWMTVPYERVAFSDRLLNDMCNMSFNRSHLRFRATFNVPLTLEKHTLDFQGGEMKRHQVQDDRTGRILRDSAAPPAPEAKL